MSTVLGRVVVRETSAPVVGLVAAAYAAGAGAGADGARAVGIHRRLGSRITGEDGRFEITYQVPEELRADWDLVVTVSPPDDSGEPGASPEPLVSAGRSDPAPEETFLFRISVDQLIEIGVVQAPDTPDDTPIDPAPLLARQARDRELRAVFDTHVRQVAATRLQATQQLSQQVDGHFGRFMQALSGVEEGNLGRYVTPEQTISAVSREVVQDGITNRVNTATAEGAAVFSQAQLDELTTRYGKELTAVPAAALERLWGQRAVGANRTWEAAEWCKNLAPINDCVSALDPKQPEHHDDPKQPEHHDHQDMPGGDPPRHAGPDAAEAGGLKLHAGVGKPPAQPAEPQATQANVRSLISRLTATMTSPEEQVLFGVRPSVGDVQGNVDGFSLRSGPADVPAVYDFHRLEIAFAPVWQELFDKWAVRTGRKLYEQFVQLGQDPNEYLFSGGVAGVDSLSPQFLPWLPFGIGGFTVEAGGAEPPPLVVQEFGISKQEWNVLPADYQDQLTTLAQHTSGIGAIIAFVGTDPRDGAQRIIEYARAKLREPRDFDRMHELLDELGKRLKEPYRFNVYAAGPTGRSVNFALLVSYRQKWTPLTYQVGELVQTVPMAPKEVRKYSKKITRKLTRSEKEMRSSLQSLRTESTVTARVESEIISKARGRTNFETAAEGGFQVGVWHGSGSAKFGVEADKESAETKREFRESVFKAAAEYRSEHKVEVETSDASEYAEEQSGEISNPNDELPVTYLFYELQRRYRVEEKLSKVTPVVMVAQEFPTPDEIDEDWIVAHDWILRRVILDDSFVPAINYLASKVVGDEKALQEQHYSLEQRRQLLEQLGGELVTVRRTLQERYQAMQQAIQGHAAAETASGGEGALVDIHEFFWGSDDPNPESYRIVEDAAKDAYERVERQERELRERLDRETAAVAEMSNHYTKALSEHLNRRTQISRLRVHLKANIIYYMQAIWSHEPSDQRYFRLRDVPVPRLTGEKAYQIVPDPDAAPVPPTWTKPHKLKVTVDIDPTKIEYDALGDVADLDNLLGFKGNYMMFPL
ncbi:MAG: hypothetical protein ACRDT8_04180, partial [Micromonosporaceae bacterium]